MAISKWVVDYLDVNGKRVRKSFETRGEAEKHEAAINAAKLAKRVAALQRKQAAAERIADREEA